MVMEGNSITYTPQEEKIGGLSRASEPLLRNSTYTKPAPYRVFQLLITSTPIESSREPPKMRPL